MTRRPLFWRLHRDPPVGALIRWRDRDSEPWQYGYFRGYGFGGYNVASSANGPIDVLTKIAGDVEIAEVG